MRPGISHCGAGLSLRDAHAPAVVTVEGLRIAFFSYMQRYDVYMREDVYATARHGGVARLPDEGLRNELDALAGADLRVVLVHWVAPTLRSPLYSESWRRGSGRREPTS
jgi:hypothetical protein